MNETDVSRRQTVFRVLCLVILLGIAGVCIWAYVRFGKTFWELVSDTDRFKAWIDGCGAWGGVVFTAVRTLQTVVKIIPAKPLEIGAGLVYGAVGGMLLCLAGNVLGSIIALLLARVFGTRVLALFHLDKKLASMRFLQDKEKRRLLLFIFYLIPGTPKDGITYFVGLTDVNLIEFMVMTTVARIPSIFSSTICGAFLGQKNWSLTVGIFAVTTLLGVLGALLYKKLSAKYNT